MHKYMTADLTCLPSLHPGKEAGGKLKAVKLEEEELLLRFYAGKAQAMCRAFHFPAKVAPAAVAYLQRFFTRHSVLDHHPRDVMLAAVYVACKVGQRVLPLTVDRCNYLG